MLQAFDGYWGGKPATDRLVFKYILEASTRIAALRTGSVDVIDSVPVQLVAGLRKEANLDVMIRPSLRPIGLAINLSHPPYDDVRVRRALNHAIPVETIAERVFFGFAKASDSPLAFDTRATSKQRPYEYSVAKAKALAGRGRLQAGRERPARARREAAQDDAARLGRPLPRRRQRRRDRPARVPAGRDRRRRSARSSAARTGTPCGRSGRRSPSTSRYSASTRPTPRASTISSRCSSRTPTTRRGPPSGTSDATATRRSTSCWRRRTRTPIPPSSVAALGEAQRIVWEDAPYVWLHVNRERHRRPQGRQGRRALADRVHDCSAGARARPSARFRSS